MKCIIDSSAWIDYFEGTSFGEKVSDALKNNSAFVVDIVIAEVLSKIKRKGKNPEVAYDAIASNAEYIGITPQVARQAGLLHAEIKQKDNSFGMADAIIVSVARSINAKILTKDKHFQRFKDLLIG